jgi:putative transposase
LKGSSGKQRYLWRAVNQDGCEGDQAFFFKLQKGSGYSPRVAVANRLESYGAAHRELGTGTVHETERYRNNRAENSHQPTRQKGRQTRGLKSVGHAQRPLTAQALIQNLFRHDRHLMSPWSYRVLWSKGMAQWNEVVGIVTVVLEEVVSQRNLNEFFPGAPKLDNIR